MIDKSWGKVPIGEILNGFFDGPHATPRPSNDGPIFLGIKNISDDGLLNLENIRHISEEDFPKWIRRVEPKPNDIVFTYEATLNRYAIIPHGFRGCLGRRLALIRPNPNKAYYKYLFYYFFGKEWRDTIANNMILGSTVDRIPLIDFPNFEITLPPILIQHKIAFILSAYDDLLENNTRRIQILEEMAQSIYREWFVHFKFPGHENVQMVDSELGRIPSGWEVKRVDEVSTIFRGRSYKSSELTDGLPFLNLKNVSRGGGFRHDGTKQYSGPYKEHQVAYPGDIIIAVTDMTQDRGIIARPARVPNIGISNFIYSMDLVRPLPNDDIESEYLFCMFSYSIFSEEVKEYANGTNVLHLSPARIAEYRFILPNLQIRSDFSNMVRPIFKLIDNLQRKNQNLLKTRDLLLPKLISGKIDVSDLDIDIGETDV